jgi:iduronate 2-sulfatase
LKAPSVAVKRDGEISQYSEIPLAAENDPFPEELTRTLIHGYYAGVSYVDVQIGKVLTHLKETGLDKNTIVVLWGDHGYLLGEMGMWTKHVNYELANRIPLIIKHPKMQMGFHSEGLIETVDLYPTLATLSKIAIPTTQQKIDGLSYDKYILHPNKEIRETVYHCFPREGKLGRAIRNKDYRLIAWQSIKSTEPAVYELYSYKDGLVETENIWREDHPEFLKLKKVLDAEPVPLPMRPESKPKK